MCPTEWTIEKRFPLMQLLQWYPEPSCLYRIINYEYGIEIALNKKSTMIFSENRIG